MRIIVTGTPGTGKTVLARRLARKLKHQYVDITAFVKKHHVHHGTKDGELLVDPAALRKALVPFLRSKKDVVIDGHLAHELPAAVVDMCLVTSCSLAELKRRLRERGYSNEKIKDNLDAEIFDVCREEAKANGHQPLIVLTDR